MTIALLTALASAYAFARLLLGYSRPPEQYEHLAAREAAFLESAAEAMFPAGGAIPVSGREANLPRYVDGMLDGLNRQLRLQIRMMLLLVEQATIVLPAPGPRGRRRFSSLNLEQRVAVLRGWTDSRLLARRLVFTALRAVLTMGYLAHPATLRHLRLAPLAFDTPVCEADLIYPPIGRLPTAIRFGAADLTPPSDGTPLDIEGPLRADYREGV